MNEFVDVRRTTSATGLGLAFAALVVALWPSSATAESPSESSDRVHGNEVTGAQAESPETPQWSAARTFIQRGEELVRVGNYESALVDFLQSYELLAQHPRRYVVLYNIALCHERMFRYDAALQYFQRYLDEGGPEAEDRAKVSRSIESLRNLLATVQVTANVGGELWIDGRSKHRVPAVLSIPAGMHVLELRAPHHESARRAVVLRARVEYRYRFHLARAQRPPDVSPIFFVSSAGLATASLVAAIVLAVSSSGARDSSLARADASMHLRTPELEERQANIRDLALATDIAFGSAALFGTAALVFYFLTDRSAGDSREGGSAVAASGVRDAQRPRAW